MAHRVVSISSYSWVTPTKLHLGVHTGHFLLLPLLEAGSLWVQITLLNKNLKKMYSLKTHKTGLVKLREILTDHTQQSYEHTNGLLQKRDIKEKSKTWEWKVWQKLQVSGRKAGIYFLRCSPFLSPPLKNKTKKQHACDKGKEKTAIYTFSRNRRECLLGDYLATDVQLCLRDGWLPVGIRLFWIGWPTSHLLLQTQYDLDSLLQDDQLGLGLVALQVDLTHPAQLSEGFIYVTNTHSLPSVVSKAALTLPLLLLLSSQVLIGHRDKAAAGRTGGGLEGLVNKPKSQPSLNLGKVVSLKFQLDCF